MEEKLKTCPFCGGNAHIVEIGSGKLIVSYSVSCDDIQACIAGDPMKCYPTEAQAIAAWNRRAE